MLNVRIPEEDLELRPRITVVGVGGGGGNAVNNMIRSDLQGVEFLVCNTDAQALKMNAAERKIQLGLGTTRGLGAGARPEVGRAAAEEALEEIMGYLEGSNMVFITAGMGGGSGSGGAPVIARAARDAGILTVGVVTKPFHFEGAHRMRLAEQGIEELQQYVDTLLIIPNQNLFRVANEKTTFADAFKLADEVLHSGVRGVTDLMVMPGLINLDFADIRSVMSEMGKAMMGTGEATGERRAVEAAEAAINNPLLEDASMQGARGLLVNITGGMDMTLFEVDEAMNRIRDEVDPEANIIFGSTFNPELEGKIRVSVVATGIDGEALRARQAPTAVQYANAIAQPVQTQNHVANEVFAQRSSTVAPNMNQGMSQGISQGAFGRGNVAPATRQAPQQPLQQPSNTQAPIQPQRATGTTAASLNQIRASNPAPTYYGRASGGAAAARRVEEPLTVGALEADTYEESVTDRYAENYEVEAPAAYEAPKSAAPQTVQQRGERDGDHFIPPAAMMLDSKTVNATGALGGGTNTAPQAAPAARHETTARQGDVFAEADLLNAPRRPTASSQETQSEKRPGLFDRLTGGSRQAAPAKQAEAVQPALAVDNSDRMPASTSIDDELDIPAFLRRQAS